MHWWHTSIPPPYAPSHFLIITRQRLRLLRFTYLGLLSVDCLLLAFAHLPPPHNLSRPYLNSCYSTRGDATGLRSWSGVSTWRDERPTNRNSRADKSWIRLPSEMKHVSSFRRRRRRIWSVSIPDVSHQRYDRLAALLMACWPSASWIYACQVAIWNLSVRIIVPMTARSLSFLQYEYENEASLVNCDIKRLEWKCLG